MLNVISSPLIMGRNVTDNVSRTRDIFDYTKRERIVLLLLETWKKKKKVQHCIYLINLATAR